MEYFNGLLFSPQELFIRSDALAVLLSRSMKSDSREHIFRWTRLALSKPSAINQVASGALLQWTD